MLSIGSYFTALQHPAASPGSLAGKYLGNPRKARGIYVKYLQSGAGQGAAPGHLRNRSMMQIPSAPRASR
ncbi:MAG TPA: hypothetical protein VHY75_02340 [Steroidobacteraceae bacterium]|jgi:hypothetical protein|nr:hypothetical protein [Steroidobacteraceae bacterium]